MTQTNIFDSNLRPVEKPSDCNLKQLQAFEIE